MFNRGDKVITKDHTRYWDITTTGEQLGELQEVNVKGGRDGVVTEILDDGMGGVSIAVRHNQDDYREYSPDELEKQNAIKAHKGGRTISKRTDVTPEVADMLRCLWRDHHEMTKQEMIQNLNQLGLSGAIIGVSASVDGSPAILLCWNGQEEYYTGKDIYDPAMPGAYEYQEWLKATFTD